MHCSACDHENPDHARFCLQCGNQLYQETGATGHSARLERLFDPGE